VIDERRREAESNFLSKESSDPMSGELALGKECCAGGWGGGKVDAAEAQPLNKARQSGDRGGWDPKRRGGSRGLKKEALEARLKECAREREQKKAHTTDEEGKKKKKRSRKLSPRAQSVR